MGGGWGWWGWVHGWGGGVGCSSISFLFSSVSICNLGRGGQGIQCKAAIGPLQSVSSYPGSCLCILLNLRGNVISTIVIVTSSLFLDIVKISFLFFALSFVSLFEGSLAGRNRVEGVG